MAKETTMMEKLPLEKLCKNFNYLADKIAFYQPDNGKVRSYSWKDIERIIRSIITGLHQLGLNRGDAVAIYGKNSVEWIIADWAIMLAGMISIPVYPTANTQTLKFIVSRTNCKAVFIGKLDDKNNVNEVFSDSFPQIAFPYESAVGNISWLQWLENDAYSGDLHTGASDSVLSIMYTSGSTGDPKGVELVQSAYAAASMDTCNLLNVNENDRLFSYLPLAHIAERVLTEGLMIYSGGASTYFTESLDTFTEDLQSSKPTIFFSVPRLWMKFLAGVEQTIPRKKLDFLLRVPMLKSIVKRKIKQKLGFSQTRIWLSGAAPISKEVILAFEKLDVFISEAWGMTEITATGCINFPYKSSMAGTIGKPFTKTEIRLSEQGEIQVKGQNVFDKYHLNPDATSGCFTEDGWFKTQDRGEWDQQGALKIIGRLKEEFKTTTGKYIIPSPIESKITSSDLIELACVMGSNRPQPFAVVMLAEHISSLEYEVVSKKLHFFLDTLNSSLENHQKLSNIIVASEPWTIENNALTPTMKVRRFEIETRFKDILNNSDIIGKVVWESETR